MPLHDTFLHSLNPSLRHLPHSLNPSLQHLPQLTQCFFTSPSYTHSIPLYDTFPLTQSLFTTPSSTHSIPLYDTFLQSLNPSSRHLPPLTHSLFTTPSSTHSVPLYDTFLHSLNPSWHRTFAAYNFTSVRLVFSFAIFFLWQIRCNPNVVHVSTLWPEHTRLRPFLSAFSTAQLQPVILGHHYNNKTRNSEWKFRHFHWSVIHASIFNKI